MLPPINDRLTWSETEEVTHLPRHVIRYRIKQGTFPRPVRVDGHWPVFVRQEIEAYIATRSKPRLRQSVRDAAYVRKT